MKKIRHIILLIVGILLFLNILLIVLVNVPWVQQRLVNYGVSWLSNKTGAEVSIGRVGVDIFQGVFLDDLYVSDLHKDTLLSVGLLQVDVPLFSAYHNNKLFIDKLKLSDFYIRITKDSVEAPYNFQFIVDSFSSNDTTVKDSPSNFDMEICSIILENGHFVHLILPDTGSANLFDVSNLDFTRINGDFSLHSILMDKLAFEVSSFSFKEQSGLILNDWSTDVYVKDSVAFVDDFSLELPNSQLNLGTFTYALKDSSYEASVLPSSVSLADLSCFSPYLQKFSEPVSLSADLKGTFPVVSVSNLNLKWSPFLSIEVPLLYMSDCLKWQDSEYKVNISSLRLTDKCVAKIESLTSIGQSDLLHKLLPFQMSTNLVGKPEFVDLSFLASTPVGKVSSSGTFGYSFDKKSLFSDLKTKTSSLIVQNLLPTSELSSIALDINTQLYWSLASEPEIHLSGSLSDLIFKNYVYTPITLSASYLPKQESSLNLVINDPNLTCSLQAQVSNIVTDSMTTILSSSIKKISPFNLHLIDTLRHTDVAAKLDLNLKGYQLNDLEGSLYLDSFLLKTDSTSLFLKKNYVIQTKKKNSNLNKHFQLHTDLLTADIIGEYDFTSMYSSFSAILSRYLPTFFRTDLNQQPSRNNNFSYTVKFGNLNKLADILNLDMSINSSSYLSGYISDSTDKISLYVDLPEYRYNNINVSSLKLNLLPIDTSLVLDLSTDLSMLDDPEKRVLSLSSNIKLEDDKIQDSLLWRTSPDSLFMSGFLKNKISFKKLPDDKIDVQIQFEPSDMVMNHQHIQFNPAVVRVLPQKIQLSDFSLSLDGMPLFQVSGNISEALSDTLSVSFQKIALKTLLAGFYRPDFPLNCVLEGDIYAAALLGDKVRFFTRDFRADSIVYDDNLYLGDLILNARWNNEKKGVLSKIFLTRENKNLMSIQGIFSPANKYVRMMATLDSIPLQLVMPFTSDYVSDVNGYLGASVVAKGHFSDLDLSGFIYLLKAKAKVNYTGVSYSISDSVKFNGNRLYMNNFKVLDDQRNELIFSGNIEHTNFEKFDYSLTMNMRNFLLLNNPKSKSNMLYGTFYANGKNLTIKGSETYAKVTGEFSNAEKTNVTIKLPESLTEAQSYSNIVYVKSPCEMVRTDTSVQSKAQPSFDLSADVLIGITEKATFYVSVADGAMINGNGNLRLNYSNGNVLLYNRYTVNSGYIKIKLAELPAKKFLFQNGSYVEFNGNPMRLNFNATASYDLNADLSTLNTSFSTMGLSSTRVPVECELSATGSLSNMNISYNIVLPRSDEEIVQNVNSIITNDNIKIKEFAYLIGLGMFYDPSGQAQGDALTSLASSSLSAALNNALSDVLGDKLTIGTDFNSSQENFSNMEMNVSVSTKLFNDRLLLSSSVGYQTQSSETGESSVLGDFDAEYLLTKSGMFRVKAYNHTNNDFYRTANNTQGVGFVFVKEGKTIKSLLQFKPDKNKLDLAPRDTVRTSEPKKK